MRYTALILPALALLVLPTVLVEAEDTAPQPQHLLVVNDDGIDAPGLAALVEVLSADPAYRITIIAPAEPQSGKGHSMTIRQAIQVSPHEAIFDCPAWAVFATPATTVNLALATLLHEDPPDLVLSGINRGENVGRITWYSGTVGAAREAVLNEVPAIAFSLQLDWDNPQPDYRSAARWAKPVVDAVSSRPLLAGTLLNVNIPHGVDEIRGYRVTTTGLAEDSDSIWTMTLEEQGTRWYEVKRWRPAEDDFPGTDTRSLHGGSVVISPLILDPTAYQALTPLLELDLVPPGPATAQALTEEETNGNEQETQQQAPRQTPRQRRTSKTKS